MTSATYLIEVRDDGMTAVGRLDQVFRTVSLKFADFTDRTPERWISLTGRIVEMNVRDETEAKMLVRFAAGMSL